MKDLRLYFFSLIFLMQLLACNSKKPESAEPYFSDNLALVKTDISTVKTIPNLKSPGIRMPDENDGMMEVELGTVAQALHPKLYESNKNSWIPQKKYILLMENFIIENGELRECLSIKN